MKTALNSVIKTISGSWGTEDIEGNGVNIIRTTNFRNDGKIDFSDIVKRSFLKKVVDEKGRERFIVDYEKINNNKLLHEDIIIEKSGGGPETPVGRVVFFEQINEDIFLNNNFTQVLRVESEKIIPKYLFYFLRQLYANRVVLKYQNQTTGLANLKLERYLREEIYIPDFDRQNLVITQLDIVQSLIDKKIKVLSILDEIILSIYKSIFGNPLDINSQWSRKKLSDICDWKTGGTPSTNNSLNYEGTIPWFTSGELGNVFLEDSIKHISDQALTSSNAKIIKPFSLLIGLYDSAAFKMSITTKECACNQAVIYGKLPDEKNTVFLYYTLFLSKEFYLTKRKGARQKNLNSSFIKNIAVAYPTKKEENEKVLLFFELHTTIQYIKKKQNITLNLLRELFRSLMLNSFKEDVKIEEEPIFKDLIKKFSIQDLQGNQQRLQYLINLFDQQNFDEFQDFTNARKILFELMESDEIVQILDGDKVKLQVK
jgi:type I restriction enzyme, S subunit